MSTSTRLLAALCLMGTMNLGAGAAIEVVNGGFEQPSEGGTVPGWTWIAPAGGAAVVNEGRDGGRCVRIDHGGEGSWVLAGEPFAVEPGQVLEVRAWLRAAAGSNRISLHLVALTDEGEVTSRYADAGRAYPEDGWMEGRTMFTIPAGCRRARVALLGLKPSQGWMDDVRIALWQPPSAGRPVTGWRSQRLEERLGRGVVAVPAGEGVHVSWRLLKNDPETIAFDVYRRAGDGAPGKLNAEPIRRTTDFTDTAVPDGAAHAYAAVEAGTVPSARTEWSAPVIASPARGNYVSIPLNGPHTFQRIGLGDLDGDGRLDYVIKQPDSNVDPYNAPGYWKRSEGTYTIEAYRHDGEPLWTYDLGWSIERGVWYSPYLVWDLDADGRCEVILKSGQGDGRDADGRVLDGPEYLTILDGATGEVKLQTPYLPPRGLHVGPWAYNRYDSRNQMAVAYLDGATPCLIVERGTYELVIVKAFQFHDGRLEELWTWRSDAWSADYWGQGAHSIRIADVDADGRDEVCIGGLMLDDTGTPLWTTGLGHPDHVYIGDLDPRREGLEAYLGQEKPLTGDGLGMVDAATGRRLWGWDQPTVHIHSAGLVADLDGARPGAECYSKDRAAQPQAWWLDARGAVIGREDLGFGPLAAYWDADPQRELLHRTGIPAFAGEPIAPAVEGRVVAVADCLGDWREEIITTVNGELRIYTTPLPAVDRRVCLLQDPIYRMDVLTQSMGYTQIPTLSYDMATGAGATSTEH
ncbi:MAG: silent information regulator protein Sir2 [Planctomycetes bacterium]|nr:silent information regulator protein Sir2 [Planctomycetota bacterium]